MVLKSEAHQGIMTLLAPENGKSSKSLCCCHYTNLFHGICECVICVQHFFKTVNFSLNVLLKASVEKLKQN